MDSKLFKKRAKSVLKAYTKEELEGIDFDNPTVDDVIKIADMGNVTTDWLLGVESKDAIDKILESKEIRECVDKCVGKEVEQFIKWSRNWMHETYTKEEVCELFAQYRNRHRLSAKERQMVDVIQKEAVLMLLCPDK